MILGEEGVGKVEISKIFFSWYKYSFFLFKLLYIYLSIKKNDDIKG